MRDGLSRFKSSRKFAPKPSKSAPIKLESAPDVPEFKAKQRKEIDIPFPKQRGSFGWLHHSQRRFGLQHTESTDQFNRCQVYISLPKTTHHSTMASGNVLKGTREKPKYHKADAVGKKTPKRCYFGDEEGFAN